MNEPTSHNLLTSKLNFVIFISLIFLTANCVKKTFAKIPEPAVIIQLGKASSIDIVQEPLKEGRVKWSEKDIDAIEIEGALRVQYKGNDYFYWQIACVSPLQCNGEKAYIPISMTEQYAPEKMPFFKERQPVQNLSFYVAKKEDKDNAIAFRNFVSNVSSGEPPKFMPEMLKLYFDENGTKNVIPGQNLVVELFLYSLYAQEKKESLENLKGLREFNNDYGKYSMQTASLETNAAGNGQKTVNSKFSADMYKHMDTAYKKYLATEVSRFPVRAVGYDKLADEFMKLKKVPGAREHILLKLTAEKSLGLFSNKLIAKKNFVKTEFIRLVEALGLKEDEFNENAFSLKFGKWQDGLILTYTDIDKNTYDFYVKIEDAKGDDDGLIFGLTLEPVKALPKLAAPAALAENEAKKAEEKVVSEKAKDGETQTETLANAAPQPITFKAVLSPVKSSKYLNIFKEFETKAKDMAKNVTDEKLKSDISNENMFLFAVKYGRGGLDKKSGEFDYAIDLGNRKAYNIYLAMAKNIASSGSATDSDYSGTISDSLLGETFGEVKNKVRWVQKAKSGTYSFYLTGSITECQRSCHTREVEELCFDNGSVINVSFDPTGLTEGIPKVRVDYPSSGKGEDAPSTFCDKILKPADSL